MAACVLITNEKKTNVNLYVYNINVCKELQRCSTPPSTFISLTSFYAGMDHQNFNI